MNEPFAGRGRLRRPPERPARGTPQAGRSDVHVDGEVIGQLYVPTTSAERLVILLHGAGGTAEAALRLLLPYADDRHLMLYAPQSTGSTWDMIGGAYGPDVELLQAALDRLPAPVGRPPAIGGFSDGASYALSLGLTNGDLFDAVLAFSPGFAAPTEQADRPGFFVSHGTHDRVLPIEPCSRRLVRALRSAGYPVEYREFDGGHEVPATVTVEALDWLGSHGAR